MNILPFILSFILVFSFSIGLIYPDRDFLIYYSKSLQKTLTSAHLRYNELAPREYKRLYKEQNQPSLPEQTPSKSSSKKQKEKPSLQKEEPSQTDKEDEDPSLQNVYFREIPCTKEKQKFNLQLLLQTQNPSLASFAKEPAALLIRKLYEKTPFYKTGVEYALLEELLSLENISLPLSLKDPELDRIFYHMQRGSSTYNNFQKKGVPRFWDYFTLERKRDRKFLYDSLCREVLEAFFGIPFVEKIAEKEKEKQKPLSSQELGELVKSNRNLENIYQNNSNYFKYSK